MSSVKTVTSRLVLLGYIYYVSASWRPIKFAPCRSKGKTLLFHAVLCSLNVSMISSNEANLKRRKSTRSMFWFLDKFPLSSWTALLHRVILSAMVEALRWNHAFSSLQRSYLPWMARSQSSLALEIHSQTSCWWLSCLGYSWAANSLRVDGNLTLFCRK